MDAMMRTSRRVLSGLVALGLALGLSTGLAAQEEQQQEMGAEAQVNQQQLQKALENPDEQLRQIRQMSDVEQRNVKVVKVDQIVRDQQTVQQWRQQNREAITKFQNELRDNQTVSQALQQKDHRVDDVLAAFVGDHQRQEMGREEQPQPQQEGERQAGQQQKTLYVVISASGETRSEMGRTTEQDSVIN